MDGSDGQISIDTDLDQKKKNDGVGEGAPGEDSEPLNLGDEEEDYYDAMNKDTGDEYDMSLYMDPNGDRAAEVF